MDPETTFVAAFIFGYVAELAWPWICRRLFGARRDQPGKKAAGKRGTDRTRC